MREERGRKEVGQRLVRKEEGKWIGRGTGMMEERGRKEVGKG